MCVHFVVYIMLRVHMYIKDKSKKYAKMQKVAMDALELLLMGPQWRGHDAVKFVSEFDEKIF